MENCQNTLTVLTEVEDRSARCMSGSTGCETDAGTIHDCSILPIPTVRGLHICVVFEIKFFKRPMVIY